MGRPAHKPTKQKRADVLELASLGLTLDRIAALVHVGATTLKEKYAPELHEGRSGLVRDTARRLRDIGKQVDPETNNSTREALTATIFTLKTIGGWREASRDRDADFFEPLTAKPAKVRDAILAAFSTAASPMEAAAFAGVSVTELNELRDADPKFAAECDRAAAMARARVEAVFRAAAMEGDVAAARTWLERRHADFHPDTNRPASTRLESDDDQAATPFEYL